MTDAQSVTIEEYIQALKDELTRIRESKYGCSHEFEYGFEAAIQFLRDDLEANR